MNAQDGFGSIIIAGGSLVLGWLAKWFVERLKHDKKTIDSDIKELRKDISALLVSNATLTAELKHVSETLKMVAKLEIDVAALGRKLRDKFES